MLTVRYDWLGLEPGDRVLDLGCGFGRHAYESLRRGARVVACDYSLAELKDVSGMVAAIEAEEALPSTSSGGCVNGDGTRLPFADESFDRVIASEVLEHIPDDASALRELHRVLRPGGTVAITVPAWLPERINWALTEEYHAPFVDGGHVRIYTEAELRSRLRAAGLKPGAAHHAHAIHSPYWWIKCAVGVTNDDHWAARAYHQLLLWDIAGTQPMARITRLADRVLNPVIGKSLVVYHAKARRMSFLVDVPGIVSAPELRATVDAIAEWQLPSGMVPWFPGGHADPWNHVEAAMALDLGGERAAAERAYQWLVDLQRPDGAWHQYYLDGAVEQDKLDANVCAYIATGVWHHWLLSGDRGFAETMWPVVERAIDFVLDLQTPRGEIIWARHADGTPWSFALLTGSSSICHSLRCAIALAELLGRERPDWELSAARLADVIAHQPEAFSPKHRWAMDWYYPVLCGIVLGDAGRARLAERSRTFVMDGNGVRCVSDRPWVTVAETCECALAHLAVGDRERAEELFSWTAQFRHGDDRYWTGTVFPDEARFPAGERSTYTAASVILCADALTGASRASALFVDTEAVLPTLIDTSESVTDRD